MMRLRSYVVRSYACDHVSCVCIETKSIPLRDAFLLPVPYGRGFRLLFCLCAVAAAGVKFRCASLAIRLFFRGLPLLRGGVACDDGHQILSLIHIWTAWRSSFHRLSR